MNLLNLLLRTSKRAVVLSILAGIGGGLCGIGLIALIHAELQRARPSLGLFAWCFVGLCGVAAFARVVAQVSLVRIAQDSVAELGLRLCRQILALPLARFERIGGSSLLAILTDDILILSSGLTGIPLLCINAPIVLACLAYVGWLSPPVLGLALAVAVPSVLGYQAIAERGVRRLQQARAGQDALVGHFRSLIAGFAPLKLHGKRREAFLTRQVQAAAAEVRGNNTAGMALFAVAGGWSQVAFFGFIGLLLFGLRTLPAVDPDALGVTVLVTLYIMSPLEVVVTWLPILSRADVSMRRIEALGLSLDAQAVETIEAAAIPPWTLASPVELRDVTYSYAQGEGRDPFVLGPIDLTLRPGEIVFLVGGNGSGKTTLVKLVTGLYAPDAGTVSLGARPIAADGWEAYRELFSASFTGGHLFDSLHGLDHPELAERARDGLARLELDDLVQVRDGAFTTTELSQGQRDRLVLLTLLLEDRPVVVFDEWASNQDPNFRRVFYQEILPELRARRKCLLVISHDEAFFHVADRVVRLDGGRAASLDLPAARKPLRAGHAHAEALP